jgi:hypothetical protein
MKPTSISALEKLGRVRLSPSFFFRDFLYSEISQIYCLPNVPDDPDLAIAAGTRLCEELLEPLQENLGRLAIRSGFRSCEVNQLGNEKGHNCSSNEANFAGHIWDRKDSAGNMGATACVVVTTFVDYFDRTGDWQSLAWWIHDHLPYSHLVFFPKLAAFNISWNELPAKTIYSYVQPRGYLTKPGRDNHEGNHSAHYADIPLFKRKMSRDSR